MHARLHLQEGAEEATSSSGLCVHTHPCSLPTRQIKWFPQHMQYTDGGHCAHKHHSEAFPSLGLTTVLQPGVLVCLYWLESSVRQPAL